ncbi:hypothetical protein UMNF18_IncI1062 (plasmid) [Escherichia coli UMNF18]|nr:hypothetical protein UMNF18_IncI1062 [Escherichia coli UMNF18]
MNMTHSGRQFVPLPQRLAVRRRLCVSGFASMSGIPGAVSGGLTSAERQRLKELERENRELRRSNDILRQASAYFAKAEFDRLWKK